MLGSFVPGQRADDHCQVAFAEHFWRGVGLAVTGGFFDKLIHHIEADFFVGALASAEAEFDAHPHILLKESESMVQLGGEIVGVDARSELQFLGLVGRLLSARTFTPLAFLILELAVVDNPADWRSGIGNRFDQVETLALGQAQGIAERHDAELLLVVIDHPDFAGPDFSVSAMLGLSGLERARAEWTGQSTLAGWS
jgi:hypothetical protein